MILGRYSPYEHTELKQNIHIIVLIFKAPLFYQLGLAAVYGSFLNNMTAKGARCL